MNRTECDDPRLGRLEYAPHRVELELTDEGELRTVDSELLDSPWKETDSYYCRGCDTELEGKGAAKAHAIAAKRR